MQIIRMQVHRLRQALHIDLFSIAPLQIGYRLFHMAVLNIRVRSRQDNGLADRRQNGCQQQFLPRRGQAQLFIGKAGAQKRQAQADHALRVYKRQTAFRLYQLRHARKGRLPQLCRQFHRIAGCKRRQVHLSVCRQSGLRHDLIARVFPQQHHSTAGKGFRAPLRPYDNSPGVVPDEPHGPCRHMMP